MRYLVIIYFVLSAPAYSQEFTTPDAIAAKEAYEAELKQLRRKYSKELVAAAKTAKAVGAAEEVERIKEVRSLLRGGLKDDAVAIARSTLAPSNWTFNRPKKPNTLSFLEDGVVKLQTGKTGVWRMLEPQVAAMRFRQRTTDNMFLVEFNEEFTQFSVLAYGPIKTDFRTGQKIK
jgi:hypothetical protein